MIVNNYLNIKIKKILYYKTFYIVNDKFIVIDNNIRKIDVIKELLDTKKETICYDDNLIEKIYNSILNDMDSIYVYYYNLQDKIEEMLYPNRIFYYLIINISKIYHLIDLGRFFLEKWFNNKNIDIKKIPYSDKEFIELEKQNYIYYISVLSFLYKDNCIDLEDIELIDMYDYELDSFCSLISLIPKIECSSFNEVKQLIKYVDKSYDYLLKKYEEYQENNQNNFKEEDNDI